MHQGNTKFINLNELKVLTMLKVYAERNLCRSKNWSFEYWDASHEDTVLLSSINDSCMFHGI